jgi:hypothetical protein
MKVKQMVACSGKLFANEEDDPTPTLLTRVGFLQSRRIRPSQILEILEWDRM